MGKKKEKERKRKKNYKRFSNQIKKKYFGC